MFAGPRTVAFDDDEVADVVDHRLLWSEPEVMVHDDDPPAVGSWIARTSASAGPTCGVVSRIASTRRTSVWHRNRGCPPELRSPTGRSPTTSSNPGTRRPRRWRTSREPWVSSRTNRRAAVAFPYPARSRSVGAQRLTDAARTLGWHPYSPPSAIRSRARGRRERLQSVRAVHVLRVRARREVLDPHNRAPRRGGERQPRRAGARTATQIVDDARGHVTAVRFVGADGTHEEQPARSSCSPRTGRTSRA